MPRGESPRLLDDGFLLDPRSKWSWAYDAQPVTLGDLTHVQCLVLLGEPGMGKSDVLARERGLAAERAARESTVPPLWVDLRGFGNEDRLERRLTAHPDICRWNEGGAVLELFLDSLDECLLRIETIGALLPGVLAQLPCTRLRIRIACRTGSWPSTLETGLAGLLGEDSLRVYELAPLTRTDVALAARANGLDADRFLAEVAEREAVPLANRPVTLDFLLRTRSGGKQLPARRADLYLKGCRLLAAEINQSRIETGHRGRMSADNRLSLAARIAAATIFSNRYAVWTGSEAGPLEPEDLSFRDILANAPDSENWTAESIEEVLDTGLFSLRGLNRLGWAHQSYAEFLAARWVCEQGLELDQVLNLLANPHDPECRPVPQLHETAGWIASMRDDAFRALIETDPSALLRGDIATADNEQRRALAEALLSAYEQERLFDLDASIQALYRKLAHPSIADQLRPYVSEARSGHVVRRVALRIAEACSATPLQDDLVRVALARDEPIELRVAAAAAAGTAAEPSCIARLRPLLATDREEDPADQLRGYALKALWPEYLTAEELFRYLDPPRRPEMIGQYSYFLHHLPEKLSDGDLSIGLQWIQEHGFYQSHSLRQLERIADEIVVRVWRKGPDAQEIALLAEAFLSRSLGHQPLVDSSRERELLELIWARPDARHRLVVAMLGAMADDTDALSIWHPRRRLLDATDVAWLVNWLVQSTASEQAKRLGANVLTRIFDRRDPDQVSEVLRAATESELVRAALAPLIDPVEIGSERATGMKTAHERSLMVERELLEMEAEPAPPTTNEPRELVRAALERCEAGDPDGFWVLGLQLSLKPDSRRYEQEYEPDLTSLPGWAEAEEETRLRIVCAAQQYLRIRDPQSEHWLGKNSWYRPAFAGYRAMRLLFNAEPTFLTELSESDWARWAPSLVSYISTPDQTEETIRSELVCRAYRMAPEATLDALITCINQHNSEYGRVFALRQFDECWDETLLRALTEIAFDPKTRLDSFRDLLWPGLRRGFRETVDHVKNSLQEPLPTEEDGRARAVVAAALWVRSSPLHAWKQVWGLMNEDDQFGRALIAELASGRRELSVDELSEEQLADLYIWVARRYPHSDDPDHGGEAHLVSLRDETAYFRDALLNALSNRGSFQAVAAVRRIMDELPHLDWLKHVLHSAQATARSTTWSPPAPAQILSLAKARAGRLVRTGDELLDAVVASLRRLEARLHGETPAVIDLWNAEAAGSYWPKDENHLSDYVKRHLEDDLHGSGIVLGREVEIRRGYGGTGERTDIHVDAVHQDDYGQVDRLSAIVEVKGCWHRELDYAMERQLVGRYLKDNPLARHGLYFVGWYNCPQWKSDDPRRRHAPERPIEEARRFLEDQAEQLSTGGLSVRAFVMDAGLRAATQKKPLHRV